MIDSTQDPMRAYERIKAIGRRDGLRDIERILREFEERSDAPDTVAAFKASADLAQNMIEEG